MHDVLDPRDLVSDELLQRRESGYETSELEDSIRYALSNGSSAELEGMLNLLENTQRRPDWGYEEPTTWDEISSALPQAPALTEPTVDESALRDRLLAAWLGRCAGCNLGKPVEGWERSKIREYLEHAGCYPLTDYFPRLDPMPEGFEMRESWPDTTRGRIRYMARDDDIDYTILGLHILETYGFDFGPHDVAREWMGRLPFLLTYTAERAAYRNLVLGLDPPETATYRNPYREWIGAQIRADMWGYASPGDPERAARLAFQDASLSHVTNGIYGAMWAAALIASAFVAQDARAALEASLAQVPARSRLAETLGDMLELHERGLDWEKARDELERTCGHYGFVHTINNAAVVAAALLWGEGDFTSTIGLAVQGGWDTDCNGATAGSTFGAMHGTEALPGSWVDPLNDRVRSAIVGFDNSRISDLAERTLKLATKG
jgi:ADP-ribosylglycohydrolase